MALVLVSGFGAFETVEVNPSEAVARALAERAPGGHEVRCAILPVSFARAPATLDEALEVLRPRRPRLVLGLGVQSRGAGARFRLEAVASRLRGGRFDVDGLDAPHARLAERRCGLDLEALARELAARGVAADELELSSDAGGYVCEALYHHALGRGVELGAQALFLHLPRVESVALQRQVAVAARVLEAALEHAG